GNLHRFFGLHHILLVAGHLFRAGCHIILIAGNLHIQLARFVSKWYAGEIGENREYGLTYRLKDGKKLAVQDVASGKKSNVKKNIATAYSKKFSGQGYSYVMKMKYSDFQFYIKPGKKVFVCFGPYGALGAHGKVVVEIKGRL
ncbi:hypothetical protein, partial [Blautia sp.]|uniref:hypothetical protein n=1 Tax=Blautia sp. TaxID=1955243 RepID=UPI003AB905A1